MSGRPPTDTCFHIIKLSKIKPAIREDLQPNLFGNIRIQKEMCNRLTCNTTKGTPSQTMKSPSYEVIPCKNLVLAS